MIRAAVLSIGDELLLGQTNDTNARWLSEQFVLMGVLPVERRTVGDDRAAISGALCELTSTADVVVVTGGLGPTMDDLTRLALTDVVDPGTAPVEDARALDAVRAWFADRGRPMPPGNRLQALRPPSGEILENPNGTAPGLSARCGRARIICLPGPPREMMPMFDRFVRPFAQAGSPLHIADVRCAGIGESDVAERLGPLMRRDQEILVGTTASGGVVTVRIRAAAELSDAAERVAATVRMVQTALAPHAFGSGEQTLAAVIGGELLRSGRTMVTCESCTGGAIGRILTEEPGASAWYAGGFITYSNEAKVRDLGVPSEMIAQYGAVSREVAAAMAEGGVRRSGADVALAVTGIAGPDGGTLEKPVGTVFVGCALRQHDGTKVCVRHFRFPGERRAVRDRTVLLAMQMLRLEFLVDGGGDHPLLWER